MALKPFPEFRRQLAPQLAMIRERQRQELLLEIYKVAKHKVALERERERFIADARVSRKDRVTHKSVITQIKNAIRCIDTAQVKANAIDVELLANLDVLEARRLLEMAARELAWIKDEMLVGIIHPQLRTDAEVGTQFSLPQHRTFASLGFGKARIDYWFIARLDDLLHRFLEKTVKRGARDEIIAHAFDASFGRPYEPDALKTARLRLAKQLRTGSATSRQN